MIDCMECLVALARGLPEGGIYVDSNGITHATIRTQHMAFLTCTVSSDPNSPGRALINRALAKTVPK